MDMAPPSIPPDLRQARLANEQAQADYYRKMVQGTGKRDVPVWIVPSISALVSLVGIIASILLSSSVTSKNAQREQERTYARQKTQVRLSVSELRNAMSAIDSANPFPPAFINENLLYGQPPRPPTFSPDDPYYQKYELVDTVYRVCALFGWLELYRRDPSFLSGPPGEKEVFEECFRRIRDAFGEELSKEKTEKKLAEEWVDGLILKDDQRAIGEKMLEKDAPGVVIGYAAFCERLFRIPRANDPVGAYEGSQNYWIWNATRFIVELRQTQPARDFKRQRIKKVLFELDELLKILDAK
jgi:hypothetical protein